MHSSVEQTKCVFADNFNKRHNFEYVLQTIENRGDHWNHLDQLILISTLVQAVRSDFYENHSKCDKRLDKANLIHVVTQIICQFS